jgi:hypothetical protein
MMAMYDDGRQTPLRRVLRWLSRPMLWYLERQTKSRDAQKVADGYRLALDEAVQNSGIDGFRAVVARDLLAKQLEAMDRYSEALPLRRVQFELMSERKGEDHPDTLVSGNVLAMDLIGTGEFEEARTLLLSLFDLQSAQGTLGSERGLYTVNLIDQINQYRSKQPE